MSFAKTSENVQRKADHIQIALNGDVEFHTLTTGFERYLLPYEALPEISRNDVDASVTLFGRRLSMPLIISSMTGGTQEVAQYNRRFAQAAQKLGIAMGIGSQRVAMENPALEDTFRVRDVAPDILLFANLGAVQLNNNYNVDSCLRAIEMINADALILHLNPLQECMQPHGNTNFHDIAERIAEICESIEVPVIVKEVGHGISERTAGLLVNAGVDGIDVAGAGGTSWVKVESLRASDSGLAALGSALGEWGIPTVDSLLAVRNAAPDTTLIASGGVRSGMDIAKSIVLGADAAGMALPLLRAAAVSQEALETKLAQIKEELETVMFCTGSRTIAQMRDSAQLINLRS